MEEKPRVRCECGRQVQEMNRLSQVCSQVVDFYNCPCGNLLEVRGNMMGIVSKKIEKDIKSIIII